MDTKFEFPKRPKLLQCLSHCGRERTYFVSFKKCGSVDCEFCLPPKLNAQDFGRLAHLPDPMPGTYHHYKEFSEVFSRDTGESARSSLKTGKDRSAKIPFNVVKQHATNTNLLLECAECNKP